MPVASTGTDGADVDHRTVVDSREPDQPATSRAGAAAGVVTDAPSAVLDGVASTAPASPGATETEPAPDTGLVERSVDEDPARPATPAGSDTPATDTTATLATEVTWSDPATAEEPDPGPGGAPRSTDRSSVSTPTAGQGPAAATAAAGQDDAGDVEPAPSPDRVATAAVLPDPPMSSPTAETVDAMVVSPEPIESDAPSAESPVDVTVEGLSDRGPVAEPVRTPASDPLAALTGVRRADPPPAAAPTATPAVVEFDGEVWEQVKQAVGLVRQRGDGRHEVSVVLRPGDLGSVTVELIQRGDEVAVRIVTQTTAAQERLDQARLLADLASAGLGRAEVDISHRETGGQTGERQPDDPSRIPGSGDPAQSADRREGGPRTLTRSTLASGGRGRGVDLAL